MEQQPWERREGETAKAHRALTEYCRLGVDRSLAAVGQRLGRSKALMERWSSQWEWVERAVAWDEHMSRLEQRAAEVQAAERAKVWVDRDEKLRESRYLMSQKLLDKADQMLRFPLATVTRDNPDGTTSVVKPARWTMAHAGRMIQAAFEQAQLAIRNEGSLGGAVGDERGEIWDIEDYRPTNGTGDEEQKP